MPVNVNKTIFYVLVALALAALPLVLTPDLVGVLSKVLIAALFALAFSLLVSQGGMLSFGHAAYFAVGCFAAVHAMKAAEDGVLNIPTPLIPLVGGFAALVVGAVAGFFATLRSGVYFSMVTLAIAELFHTVAPSLLSWFGGEAGISSMRMPWLGITFGDEIEVYYLVLFWTIVCTLLLYLYTRTAFGRLTVALKENEKRIEFLGYNVHLTKLLVFSISAMFAGIAGGLLAIANESANYLLFNLSYSANVVLFSYIGGTGLFIGPAIGAAVMTFFGHVVSDMTRLWLLYQGLIFVFVMMYAPGGIAGLIAQQASAIRARDGASMPVRLSMLACISAIGALVIFLCEMVSVVFSRDYQAQLARSGRWEPINLLGAQWAPDHALTWGLPLLLLAVFIYLLRRVSKHRPSGE